jgi:hypothetical protein
MEMLISKRIFVTLKVLEELILEDTILYTIQNDWLKNF